MKKIIALTIAALMLVSFAACGQKTPDATPGDATSSDATAGDATPADAQENGEQPESTDATVAAALLETFKSVVADDKTPEEIANEVIANPVINFMPVVEEAVPGYLAGFSADVDGFESAVKFAPMIGTIPFVGYIFNVSGDVDAFMQTLKDNADPAWNICTQAEETVCEAVGNTVFFVMSPTTFAE